MRASRAGRVVYSGNGIRGYGEEAAAGEVIAHSGEGAPNQPMLYFEIRKKRQVRRSVGVFTDKVI